MLCGIGRESELLALFALVAVTLASILFAGVDFSDEGVPQEGLIGIVYCLALASCLFIAEFIPDGSGFVKESLTGSLLWVTWGKIGRLMIVGTAAGAFHWIFRERFIGNSMERSPSGKRLSGRWEFMFYFTLGLVIVEAVSVLGVFLVFSLLVVPAAMGLLFCRSWSARLAVSWLVGTGCSLAGILAAYLWNLPTGPSIVVVLGLTLILGAASGLCLSLATEPAGGPGSLEPEPVRESE
jgi:ABC-type Mn2+/Zn2+ transport system permease subunit